MGAFLPASLMYFCSGQPMHHCSGVDTTSKECRQHAEECLKLARQSEEFYVKSALIELAEEFKEKAEEFKEKG